MTKRIVYWFRNDLRLNDNEALSAAIDSAQEVIPVFVFDPRQFEQTKLGFRRTGALRAKFLIESVAELRKSIREREGELLIRIGEPEKIIAQIADDYNAQYVFTSKEIGPEETHIESSLSKNLKIVNVDIKLFWMDTLIHAVDLPFPIAKLPSSYADYRRQFKNPLPIKDVFPEPGKLTLPAEYEAGTLPSLPALGIDPLEIPNSPEKLDQKIGGESAARSALQDYLKSTSEEIQENPLTDSRLSDWLSLGCLSAKYIYHETLKDKSPERTDSMLNSLLERDYFHWILLRFGPRIFKLSGVKHDFSTKWSSDQAVFELWTRGETADPQINTLVTKLKSNGFLEEAQRRLVADYLVNQLGINWTWGAMYFESCLLNYEVSVNWGKWNNVAGVGHD